MHGCKMNSVFVHLKKIVIPTTLETSVPTTSSTIEK
jgi:hypothetical protein